MTDSIVAAAQFACFSELEEAEAPDSVEVVGGFKIILSSIMVLIPAPRISVDWNWVSLFIWFDPHTPGLTIPLCQFGY
jgi:hypothetical protein